MECARCEVETKYARPVAGYILCYHCNMLLIRENRLSLADGNKLTIATPPPIVKSKKQESDEYWARRKAIHEDSQQDNYYQGRG